MPCLLYRAAAVVAVALILSLPVSPAAAAGNVDRLDRFLDGLNTLEARFTQTIESGNGVTGPVTGTLYVQRPGLFRWDYDGANGQLIVADGNRVWLLDRELEQVSHQSQEAALRGTPAQLLSEKGAVEEYFTVVEAGERDGQDWIELAPKDEESQFSSVRIAFAGDLLSRLDMEDKFGQYTRFVFSDVRRNPGLDPDLFRFTPPPGWDVFQTH